MYLSDVFKYTQGLGQKGHQIGRKVGDAIELLTLGMINLDKNLLNYLVIEDGVEGATTAKQIPEVKNLIIEIIEYFNRRILYDMETEMFVQFKYQNINNSERLIIEELT